MQPDVFQRLWLQLQSGCLSPELVENIHVFYEHFPLAPQARLLQADLLYRQGELRRALELLQQLSTECAEPSGLDCSELVALINHRLGLLLREDADFEAAAETFLTAFRLCPQRPDSLHALQFTRLSYDAISRFAPKLKAVLDEATDSTQLAYQLLADWEYQLGLHESSLINSYHAARRSVSAHQQTWLDHLALPSYPEALIIGAPKCGTTSLAAWLADDPRFYVHPRKELHFFDSRWDRGAEWYRCQFPVFLPHHCVVRLEATPNYLQIPEVPERVFRLMPHVKLIVILRHPVQRAISWYQHIVRQEGITDSAEAVLTRELDELEVLSGPEIEALGWHTTNCLLGSLYSLQIKRWRKWFSPQQLLVLRLEEVLNNVSRAREVINTFMGFEVQDGPVHGANQLPKLNAAPASLATVSPGTLDRIEEFLSPEINYWLSCSDCSGITL